MGGDSQNIAGPPLRPGADGRHGPPEEKLNQDTPQRDHTNVLVLEPRTGPPAPQRKKPERVTVMKWSPVLQWGWSVNCDTCAICRNSLTEPSIQYQADPQPYNEEGLKIAVGNCNHSYHCDCINRWLQTRPHCPLCNTGWEFLNILPLHGEDPASKKND